MTGPLFNRRNLFTILVAIGAAIPAPAQPTARPPAQSPAQPEAAPAAERYIRAGLYTVQTSDESWRDDARARDVPVRIYRPQGNAIAVSVRHPVVIFSHGLGGSGAIYGYFGQHLASHGYIVIAPTHAGSDTASLAEWMGTAKEPANAQQSDWLTTSVNDSDNLRNRPRDISFIIDQVATRPTTADISDPARIGVAGHSFGAYTAMAIAGMTVDLPDAPDASFLDPRVKAVLPMSPQGEGTMGINAGAWDAIDIPVLFLTGTRDYGQGARAAAWRRQPFDALGRADTYLATIVGGTHMTFSGMNSDNQDGGRLKDRIRDRIRKRIDKRGLNEPDPDEAAHLEIVRDLSLAFFDAYLNDDPDARAWLRAFFSAQHADCQAEFRPAPGAERINIPR